MDLDRRILTTPWGKEIHLDVLAKIHPIDPIISRHKQCQLLVDLKLTEKEDAIIRAIVIMFTGEFFGRRSSKISLTSCKIHREELNMRIIFIGHFKITY
jgi:hypothetical protein